MKYYVGIDLGGTNIVAGVVDEEYNIIAKASTKTNCPRPEKEIADDMAALSEIAGYEVNGMAYPYGTYNDHIDEVLKECGIIYSRTVDDTRDFGIPENFLQWHPTINFGMEGFDELVEKFLEDSDEPKLFYVWGHSYEFDAYNSWDRFEEFCKKISGHDDVLYLTNKEVYNLCV